MCMCGMCAHVGVCWMFGVSINVYCVCECATNMWFGVNVTVFEWCGDCENKT